MAISRLISGPILKIQKLAPSMGGALSNEDPLWVLESLKNHPLPWHIPSKLDYGRTPPPRELVLKQIYQKLAFGPLTQWH